MGKADFHMHTSLNDGTATVREVLNYVRDRTDLDVIAITDHDRLTGSYEALELANEYDFDVFAGCEITTLHGHLLGLFIDKPIPMWRPLDWTIGKIHEQGGLAIAVHPFSMLTRSIGYRSFDSAPFIVADLRIFKIYLRQHDLHPIVSIILILYCSFILNSLSFDR